MSQARTITMEDVWQLLLAAGYTDEELMEMGPQGIMQAYNYISANPVALNPAQPTLVPPTVPPFDTTMGPGQVHTDPVLTGPSFPGQTHTDPVFDTSMDDMWNALLAAGYDEIELMDAGPQGILSMYNFLIANPQQFTGTGTTTDTTTDTGDTGQLTEDELRFLYSLGLTDEEVADYEAKPAAARSFIQTTIADTGTGTGTDTDTGTGTGFTGVAAPMPTDPPPAGYQYIYEPSLNVWYPSPIGQQQPTFPGQAPPMPTETPPAGYRWAYAPTYQQYYLEPIPGFTPPAQPTPTGFAGWGQQWQLDPTTGQQLKVPMSFQDQLAQSQWAALPQNWWQVAAFERTLPEEQRRMSGAVPGVVSELTPGLQPGQQATSIGTSTPYGTLTPSTQRVGFMNPTQRAQTGAWFESGLTDRPLEDWEQDIRRLAPPSGQSASLTYRR